MALPAPTVIPWNTFHFTPDSLASDHRTHRLEKRGCHEPTFLTATLTLHGAVLRTRENTYYNHDYPLSLKAVRVEETNHRLAYNPLYQHHLDAHLDRNANVPPAVTTIPTFPGHWYLFVTPPLQDSPDGTHPPPTTPRGLGT